VILITEQITIKLNKKLFGPVLESLRKFGGEGITESDSDLVGKSLFFAYDFVYDKKPECNNRTLLQLCLERLGPEGQAEQLLAFLNKYHKFKKKAGNR